MSKNGKGLSEKAGLGNSQLLAAQSLLNSHDFVTAFERFMVGAARLIAR
jgi:hypothetical protein